jgi:hypothetical protein
MNQDHFAPAADRLLVAQLTGTARHHARWRDLTPGEQTAAVTELRDLAAGRADCSAPRSIPPQPAKSEMAA